MKKIFFIFLFYTFFVLFSSSQATEDVTEIQNQIATQDKEIEKLEEAIEESQAKVSQYAGESNSLEKEIANLNYLNSKFKKSIYQKQQEIGKISQNITLLSEQIQQNREQINNLKKNLRDHIFTINQISSNSIFETVLSGQSISSATEDIVRIENLQRIFHQNISEFIEISDRLDKEKILEEEETIRLDQEKDTLSDKKFALEQNKKDKDYLLKVTKSNEETYKNLLVQQQKEKEEFEKELFELESKLQFILDTDSVPKKQIGLFAWPTPSRSDRISQFFGYTDFHSHYTTQKRHNGMDLAVPVGTPIFSVMSGTVLATGDSTKTCRGKQYGKWIAIEHGNGLTSMYAHLSRIDVSEGQEVSRSQKVGLTGNTGYSFGPHLHFTVYYSAGLEIKNITKHQSGCYVTPQNYKLPLASVDAYVEPLNYLPKPLFSRLAPVSFGNKGFNVQELQNMLTYENVFPRSVDIDGSFGPLTEKYLFEWKQKNNRPGDGKSFTQSDLDWFQENFY